jgi:hypothetical protein
VFCELVDPVDREHALHELARLPSGAARSCEGEGRLRAADGHVTRVRVEAGLLPAAGQGGETIVVRLVEVVRMTADAAACRWARRVDLRLWQAPRHRSQRSSRRRVPRGR